MLSTGTKHKQKGFFGDFSGNIIIFIFNMIDKLWGIWLLNLRLLAGNVLLVVVIC